MKIVVKSENDSKYKFLLPSCLVLNPFTAIISPQILRKYGVKITKKQAYAFIRALNKYRHRHPNWVLVEVRSSDGDHVKIKL